MWNYYSLGILFKALFILVLFCIITEYLLGSFGIISSGYYYQLLPNSNGTFHVTTYSKDVECADCKRINNYSTTIHHIHQLNGVNPSEIDRSIINIHSTTTNIKHDNTTWTLNYSISPASSSVTVLANKELVNNDSSHHHHHVTTTNAPIPKVRDLVERFDWLQPGGHWRPPHQMLLPSSVRTQKIAVIVPYRNRGSQLLLFLQHMHPFLRRQHLDYTVVVVEQFGTDAFNRALLMNVGYVETLRSRPDTECFIFHDVDLMPVNAEQNIYQCDPSHPKHMSVAIDKFQYQLPYKTIFGGVTAIGRDHFRLVNGFSNNFWGWGGEDDDMWRRIQHSNLTVVRLDSDVARYVMLKHRTVKPNPHRHAVLQSGSARYDKDGLNSLRYTIVENSTKLLYTWWLVDVKPPPKWWPF